MKTATLAIALCSLVSSISCNLSFPTTSLWFYSTENLENKDFNPSNFLYLQKDGTYTMDFGKFDYGKWQKTKKEIFLTNYKQEKSNLKIAKESWKTLHLKIGAFTRSFEEQPSDFKKTDNPFAVNYNKWRLPATRKETDAELRDRLLNHCRFWQIYFKWGIDNDITLLDVRSTPTPIKIYGNGIGLKKAAELPVAWRSYFYDSTDCERAGVLLKEVFRKHDIKWPETKNKFKLFLSAFEQIEYHLDK